MRVLLLSTYELGLWGVKIRCAFPKNADLQVGPDFWHPTRGMPSVAGLEPAHPGFEAG
jgi:hypothetical protein